MNGLRPRIAHPVDVIGSNGMVLTQDQREVYGDAPDPLRAHVPPYRNQTSAARALAQRFSAG